MPLNACELEIDLLCRGLRVADGVRLDDARPVGDARSGLGSGLELEIERDAWFTRSVWVNAPVRERFARTSPYLLRTGARGSPEILDERSGHPYPVRLPRVPAWSSRPTSSDVPMGCIGVLHGTHLAIEVNPVCAFWHYEPALNCRFCTTGRRAHDEGGEAKSIVAVVETCVAASEESGVTVVELAGGFQGTRGIRFMEPYVRAIKEETDLFVAAHLEPERDFRQYDRLLAAGVDQLTFSVELMDPSWFAEICPGKALVLGQQLAWDAMRYVIDRMPAGHVAGEIIAGLEPVDRTIEGIDAIASAGAVPVVCIFRPTSGSGLERLEPPRFDDMRRVVRAAHAACRREWLRMGVASVETSCAVTADDAALLAPRTAAFFAYETWRRGVRHLMRPFARRRRRRPARRNLGVDDDLSPSPGAA
jgi:uncharacterized radical SAM superfamily protein